MRALVIHAPRDLRIDELEAPQLQKGEVRVAVQRGGVCGSDLHYYHHGGFGAVRLREPMILGHEVAGLVEAVGADVDDLSVGTPVAINPSRPCGDCHYCLKGDANHCLDMRFYGSAMRFPHVQGAFAEVVVATAEQCVSAPASPLDCAQLAMAEPLSVALHAVRRAGDMLGARVLVCGCGPIGVLTIAVARRAGAAEIVATDLADAALEHAAAAGADRTVNVARLADGLAEFALHKGYFDVVFEASGTEPAICSALPVIRPRGVFVQVGLGGDAVALPMNVVVAKEIDLRGTFRFHEEFDWAVELMSKGLIDVRPLLTGTYALNEARSAFEIAGDREQSLKVQIAFD
ncbi:MAG: L-idonate 5-dehydrogenase [Pseudomonadota bacterium]